ncbi:phosphorylase b kinase gamma catalytic chain, liver/testis isoform-like [Dendronephthya gigantea]|uniref:phosphorylase b kinase gamma catalytic chain, liver/testis isoform-like n=1 Tax=Dendronephthya gigantea TaxID=151771 RepID=UPI00106CAB1F|nr:phosphorylase b kinase gamma catalytic chain, liver/testis isoform-like [Dendronephthya gigantea]
MDDLDGPVLEENEATQIFYAKYKLKEKLGAGLSSVVRKCVDKATGQEYAVKIVDKLGDHGDADIGKVTKNEADILAALSGHKNIISLVDFFESPTYFFLIFELAVGGELFDQLTKDVTFSEKRARKVMYEILTAVQYMHSKSIVHRDLKPENILLNDKMMIKLSDFGFAKKLEAGETLTDLCGTLGYLSPEVLRTNLYDDHPGYGFKVDLWACGVILYTLLSGCPPFWHRRQAVLIRSIIECRYQFSGAEWADISDSAKDLISKLLVSEPEERYSADDCLKHPWLEGVQISRPVAFVGRTKLRGVLIAVRTCLALRQMVLDTTSRSKWQRLLRTK